MATTLEQITFDTRDALALAQFYAAVLDREVDPDGNPDFASIGLGGENPLNPFFMFLQIPDDKVGKNRVHVDLLSTDMRADVQRAITAGATHVGDFKEFGTEWTSLLDPEGNAFDIGLGLR